MFRDRNFIDLGSDGVEAVDCFLEGGFAGCGEVEDGEGFFDDADSEAFARG